MVEEDQILPVQNPHSWRIDSAELLFSVCCDGL